MRSIYSVSQSGIQANQLKMDALANDISNVNTIGYKRSTVSFRELISDQLTEQDGLLTENALTSSINRGVQSAVTGTFFGQGPLVETGGSMHLSIDGNGFFGIRDNTGTLTLTRDGAFTVDEAGNIVNDRGNYLEVNLTLPVELWTTGEVIVSPEGTITVGDEQVGSIPLFTVENLQELQPIGQNQFVHPAGEEEYILSNGSILQGYIEESTVDLADALTSMIIAQRAYSLNATVTQSTDEIYSLINNFT